MAYTEEYDAQFRQRLAEAIMDLMAIISARRDSVRLLNVDLDSLLGPVATAALSDSYSTFIRACFLGELWLIILDSGLMPMEQLSVLMMRHRLPSTREMELMLMRGDNSAYDEADAVADAILGPRPTGN